MSTTLRKPMSRQEFFEWAEAQDERYEFDGEQPVLMTGGQVGHGRLQIKLLIMLTTHLSGSPFEVLGPDVGVATSAQRVRYPDAVVTRGFTDARARIVSDPVAVFEVISPSTSHIDRIVKSREYGAVDSIRSYVVLDLDAAAATVFQKQPDGTWRTIAVTSEETISLPELRIALPLAELYAERS